MLGVLDARISNARGCSCSKMLANWCSNSLDARKINARSNTTFLCFKIQNTNIFIFEGYGIATSKSSGLHVSINQALLNLKNQRIPQSLENKWWTSECPSGDSYIRGDLSLANVVGVFFFLAALLVLGMVLHTFSSGQKGLQ